MSTDRFDVRVLTVPVTAPGGEPFAAALSRAFGVPSSTAERLVVSCPVFVKRGLSAGDAAVMRTALEDLGAEVELVESAGAASAAPFSLAPAPMAVAVGVGAPVPVSVSSSPPAPHPAAPSGRSLELAPRPARAPAPPPPPPAPLELAPVGPPRPRPSAPPPPTPSLAPLPPPERGLSISPLALAAAALLLVGLGWLVFAKGLLRTGDEKMLGNTPEQDTLCGGHYCLTGPAAARYEGKRALVVAWRTGCLEDQDYRAFLEGLSARHREDLAVVAVGLAVPSSKDPRAFGKGPLPPPATWPPAGCELAVDTLSPDDGYVSDFLNPPATYLFDDHGKLLAAWRGGMSPEQRERLATWLDGKAWAQR